MPGDQARKSTELHDFLVNAGVDPTRARQLAEDLEAALVAQCRPCCRAAEAQHAIAQSVRSIRCETRSSADCLARGLRTFRSEARAQHWASADRTRQIHRLLWSTLIGILLLLALVAGSIFNLLPDTVFHLPSQSASR